MSTSSSRPCMFETRQVTASFDLAEAQPSAVEEPTVLACSAPRDSYMRCAQDVFVDDVCRRRRGRWMGMAGRHFREAVRTPTSSPERHPTASPPRAARTPSPAAAPKATARDTGAPPTSAVPAPPCPVPRSQTGATSPFGSSPVPPGKGFGKPGGVAGKFEGACVANDEGSARQAREWRYEQDKRAGGGKAAEARGPGLGLATGAPRTGTASPLPFRY